MNQSLAKELEFWHFDSDYMVFKDGSFGAGFKISEFSGKFCTPSELNQLTSNLENIFISSDEGLKFQVLYKVMPDVSETIDKHEKLSSSVSGPYAELAKARVAHLRSSEEKRSYFDMALYFFVRSRPIDLKKGTLFEKQSTFASTTKDKYVSERIKFERTVNQVKSLLGEAKLNPEKLSCDEWFSLIHGQLNFARKQKFGETSFKYPSSILDECLAEQVTLTDIFWTKNAVEIDSKLFRPISLGKLPENFTFSSMAEAFSNIPFHFWISQSVEILDQTKEKSSLELSRRIAHSMASGSQNVSDIESENKLGSIEGLLEELIGGSQKLVSMDLVFTIWGDTLEELDAKTDEVLKAFRSMDQSEGIQETLACKDAFLNTLPGYCKPFRNKKVKSSNAAHLMPIFGSWKGNPRPVCLLPNRDGSLFGLDPYADHLPSWNGVVVGSSGSGKSYTVVQLMAMFYGKVSKSASGKYLQPRVVWIDNGASSKRLMDVLDGEFIDLSLDSNICLNMFDLKEGETEPSSDRIRTVLAVLEMILKEEGTKSLGKREKALLEKQVVEVYKKVKSGPPTLTDLKKSLEKHPDTRMKQFAEILYSWTGDSAYGRLLDGKTNVRLSKDLVSIEVQQLNTYPDLKDVFLLLFTSFIQDISSSDIEREYLLIVDEAERLFQSELARQVVITCYRTWRKFKSGIWCLSQNYKDFMADPQLSDALLTNTTSLIILRQKKIDWNHFKETFDFNDAQIDQIKSLQIKKGEYSEFFYLQDENQTVIRLIPEPLSHWIATSDANDKAKIAELKRLSPDKSTLEVLQDIVVQDAKKPKG